MSLHTRAAGFIFLLLFIVPCFHAQNFIKGVITDSTNAPASFCAIALLNSKDSSVVKGNITDENGAFIFEKIRPGTYHLKCQAVGFQSFISASIVIDSSTQLVMDTIILKQDGVNLKEVSVMVIKPAVEFKKGIVILNVENNLSAAGNTVLELLRRLPGVTIDAQNNISINGRSGVRFLIDGRLQQIPTSQMMTVLSGMAADVVSTIELIKNPPARYDAAGSGGLINIVLKKAKVKGISGSFSESVSQGDLFRNGTTAALNFKSNKLSLFSNFSYYHQNMEANSYLVRRISDTTASFQSLTTGKQLPRRTFFYLNGGMEYEVNKKLTIGANVTGNPGLTSNAEVSQSNVTGNNPFDYDYYKFTIDTKQKLNNISGNINATYKFDTLGTQLQFSSDATSYLEDFSRLTVNNFFNNAGQGTIPTNSVGTTINNDFKIYTQKLDLTKPFKKNLTLEAGVKSSFVNNSSNSVIMLTDSATQELKASDLFSNNYRYHERILAAYTTLAKTIDKFDLKAGVRTEQTLINATTDPHAFHLHRNYINFFPSGSIDYKISKKSSIQTNYSYRIDRPGYDQMNPTRVYGDQLNYGSGNPQLKPQYSHQVGVEYNYNNFITLGLGYYQTNGFIYYYSYGNPNSKVTIDTVFNYKQRNNLAATVFIQKQIKWLSFQTFGMLTYRNFRGEVMDLPANSQTFQFYTNFNITIVLPAQFKIQLNGYYASQMRDGVQVYYPNGSMDAVILRSFFDKKLDISLSLYDVFYTQRFPYKNVVGGAYMYYTERTDSRRLRLYAIWKFGKMKINQTAKRSNDTESSRLKSTGG